MRYGWTPNNLPSTCACGKPNSIQHAQDCNLGGFLNLRHDSVRDVFKTLFEEAGCKPVETETHLLPVNDELSGERSRKVISGEKSRMDVMAVGFWTPLQRAFFDVRVFDPLAPSKGSKGITEQKLENEQEKKNAYLKRIEEVERGTFSPLVFTIAGGCGKECNAVIKKLAEKISHKSGQHSSAVMGWIRTKLNFSLLRTAIICLRGWRKTKKTAQAPEDKTDFEIVAAESRIKT